MGCASCTDAAGTSTNSSKYQSPFRSCSELAEHGATEEKRESLRLDETEIKRQLRVELLNYRPDFSPESDLDLIDSLTCDLCRDCSFGQSQNPTEIEWEAIHHQSIHRAVLTMEKDETVYYLNNIKSLLIKLFQSQPSQHGNTDAMLNELSAVYQYRMMLASNTDAQSVVKAQETRLQSGFHPKDRASSFGDQQVQIEDAIKTTVRVFDDLIISSISEFLDDRCRVCKCHLGVDFIPSHPERFLSCHACKARSRSIISKGKALDKYDNLTVEMLTQLIEESKSSNIDDESYFSVPDVERMCVSDSASVSFAQPGNEERKTESND